MYFKRDTMKYGEGTSRNTRNHNEYLKHTYTTLSDKNSLSPNPQGKYSSPLRNNGRLSLGMVNVLLH